MKKIVFILISATTLVFSTVQAQYTQVELFAGYAKTDVTLLSNQPLNTTQTFGLTTLAFFQKFNEENQQFNEIGVQPTLYYNLNTHVAVGPSLYYNSFGGFSERLSVKYVQQNARLTLVLIPSVAYSEQKKANYTELFGQFQYTIPISAKMSLRLNAQLLSVWDKFTTHSRSFQQLRGGIALNGHQLGLGIDLDQFGPKPITKATIGLYYRKNL